MNECHFQKRGSEACVWKILSLGSVLRSVTLRSIFKVLNSKGWKKERTVQLRAHTQSLTFSSGKLSKREMKLTQSMLIGEFLSIGLIEMGFSNIDTAYKLGLDPIHGVL